MSKETRVNSVVPSGKRFVAVIALLAVALSGAEKVIADHVLLRDGRALFNVTVEDVETTGIRSLRVRHNPYSFMYDYGRNLVMPLLGRARYYDVADLVTTSTTVGKYGARHFMEAQGWQAFVAPPPVVLRPFTPAPPRPTPTPEPTPDPRRVADRGLPLEERVEQQLHLFVEEQTLLSNRISFSEAVGTMERDRGRDMRLGLLRDQIEILRRHYPSDEDLVQNAEEALRHQLDLVESRGKFGWED